MFFFRFGKIVVAVVFLFSVAGASDNNRVFIKSSVEVKNLKVEGNSRVEVGGVQIGEGKGVTIGKVIVNGKRVKVEEGDWDSEEREKLGRLKRVCKSGKEMECLKLAVEIVEDGGKGAKIAREYISQSCKRGKGYGCYLMGAMAEEGEGMEEALKFYNRSCQLHFGGGCYKLGQYFEEREEEEKALLFYKKGCKWGSGESCEEYFDF